MKFSRNDVIILCLVIVVLFVDHFIINLPHNIMIWLFSGIIIYSLNYKKYGDIHLKEILNWQIVSTLLIFALVIFFDLFGAVDRPGISINSGIFWFLVLLSLFEIIYQLWQIKKGTDNR